MGRPKKTTTDKKAQEKQVVTTYTCYTCGTPYSRRAGSFNKVPSPTYRGSGGFLHICARCISKRYEEYVEKYANDEARAVRRMCEFLDLYYSPKVLEMAKSDIKPQTNLLQNYFRKMNLAQVTGVCFDETLDAEGIMRTVVTGDNKEDGGLGEAFDLFGDGFDENAYRVMLRSYHGYVDPLGNTLTAGQQKEAIFLAVLEYRTLEAFRNGAANASQLANAFRGAMKDSGFDVATRNSESNEEPFGVWIKEIENYAPAEYVRDHEIFKDEDKLGYFERFLKRPMENLLRGHGYIKDDELSIGEDEVEDDGGE